MGRGPGPMIIHHPGPCRFGAAKNRRRGGESRRRFFAVSRGGLTTHRDSTTLTLYGDLGKSVSTVRGWGVAGLKLSAEDRAQLRLLEPKHRLIRDRVRGVV